MKKEKLTVETDEDGTIRYYNAEDELHNPDGPAVIYADGHKFYYINGKLHNPDGPAVIWPDGVKDYWIKGKELTEAEFKAWQAKQTSK